MEIIEVKANEYSEFFNKYSHIYNNVAFTQLNADKCEHVHYLIFKDTKVRLGITLGERDEMLCSPFSAPFGGFDFTNEPKIEYLEQALSLLKEYSASRNKSIKLTLPPPIYDTSTNAKVINVLMRGGVLPTIVDLNYHYDLSRVKEYEKYLSRNARKNFHNALTHDFEFIKLDSCNDDDITRAYNVIKANRESHDYPLRMTLENVIKTTKVVSADFFVMSKNGEDIAAAQVFHVTDDIAQVVYWGDCPGYGEMRPMNYLTYKAFEYYYNAGIKVLDIGPSTEYSVPNYGLCEFKENLGCEISLKHTFIL